MYLRCPLDTADILYHVEEVRKCEPNVVGLSRTWDTKDDAPVDGWPPVCGCRECRSKWTMDRSVAHALSRHNQPMARFHQLPEEMHRNEQQQVLHGCGYSHKTKASEVIFPSSTTCGGPAKRARSTADTLKKRRKEINVYVPQSRERSPQPPMLAR